MVKIAAFKSEVQCYSYFNQDQRNVHIWGLVKRDLQSRDLIAGFFNHDHRVTYAVLYKWLDLIVERYNPNGGDSVLQGTQPSFGLARLKNLLGINEDRDPRFKDGAFPPLGMSYKTLTSLLNTHYIARDNIGPCEPGHYVIFYGHWRPVGEPAYGQDTPPLELERPEQSFPVAFEESIFDAGIKATKHKDDKRAAAFRTVVRDRDQHCIITETKPIQRERGTDYTGLEVAHIFPIAWANSAQRYFVGNGKKSLIKSLVKTHKKADRARNGFLLRADIHRLFDQYVWSIYGDKVYLFEKARPDAMGEDTSIFREIYRQFEFPEGGIDLNAADDDSDEEYTPTSVPKENVEPALMLFHFVCALHKNVVDMGRGNGGGQEDEA